MAGPTRSRVIATDRQPMRHTSTTTRMPPAAQATRRISRALRSIPPGTPKGIRMTDRSARRSASALRILYVQPCANFGGAERQASIVIPQLAKAGIEVIPLVGPNRTICDWLADQGVSNWILSGDFPGSWPPHRGLARVVLPARYLGCQRRVASQVARIARERAVDLVFAAMPFGWMAATGAARSVGLPGVWRAGGTWIQRYERPLLKAWAHLQRPDLLVCCGDGVRRTFEPLVPAPAVVVQNGVELGKFVASQGDPLAFRPPGAGFVVGFAARLTPQKRPEDLIEMAALVARRRSDVVFLIAGEGSRRPGYEALARARGVADRVRFLGFVSDMASFYASCDLVVL